MAQIVLGVLRRERAGNALVSITLLGRREMASLNARHLGHRGPTDVISFGLSRAANRASDASPTVGDDRDLLHEDVPLLACMDFTKSAAEAPSRERP